MPKPVRSKSPNPGPTLQRRNVASSVTPTIAPPMASEKSRTNAAR